MFDEVNEGTAIFKCSDTPPAGKLTSFITMDHQPSDHYLWLTGEAGKIIKGKKPLSFKMPERK
jgi:hypothetical protein